MIQASPPVFTCMIEPSPAFPTPLARLQQLLRRVGVNLGVFVILLLGMALILFANSMKATLPFLPHCAELGCHTPPSRFYNAIQSLQY